MVDSRVRGSGPLQQSRQSFLFENEQVVKKYTIVIVAALDHGRCRGLKKCSIYLRNTGDVDKPVFSGRRTIFSLKEVLSTKGLEKDQGRQRERRGVAVRKGMSTTFLLEKQH